MSRAGKRLFFILIWAGIGLLAGMQLGGSKGPSAADSAQLVSTAQGQETAEGHNGWGGQLQEKLEAKVSDGNQAPRQMPAAEPTPREILLPPAAKPPADVLADKTAGLLQQMSNQSIRWVVSLFGSIAD